MLAFAESSMLPMRMHFRAKMDTRRPMAPRTMPTIIRARTACSIAVRQRERQWAGKTTSPCLIRLWFNKAKQLQSASTKLPRYSKSLKCEPCHCQRMWNCGKCKPIIYSPLIVKDMHTDIFTLRKLWTTGVGRNNGI